MIVAFPEWIVARLSRVAQSYTASPPQRTRSGAPPLQTSVRGAIDNKKTAKVGIFGQTGFTPLPRNFEQFNQTFQRGPRPLLWFKSHNFVYNLWLPSSNLSPNQTVIFFGKCKRYINILFLLCALNNQLHKHQSLEQTRILCPGRSICLAASCKRTNCDEINLHSIRLHSMPLNSTQIPPDIYSSTHK